MLRNIVSKIVLSAQPADQAFLLEMRRVALASLKTFEKSTERELHALAFFEWGLGCDNQKEISFVAWMNEQRAGAVWLRCEGEPHAPHFILAGLAVSPAYQQQGIGTLLVQHALDYCRQHKACSLTLKVNPSNEAALRLYRKFGFEDVSLEMRTKLS